MAQAGLPNTPTGSNLALAYQETLTSIVRLKTNRQSVSDAQYFRQQFIQALKLANEEGRSLGYSDQDISLARFAVVAFLDETVLNLRNAAFADWARKPLQQELSGEHKGGEVFFEKLERLMRQPDSPHLADVIEVYLLCLTLGFAGKYSISGRGELLSLRQSLMSRIGRIRGRAPELSPRWRPGAESRLRSRSDAWTRPMLYLTLVCAVLSVLLFVFYKFSLQSAETSIETIAEAGTGR
jgi:type VI secretion system protein ImpK